MNSNKNQAILIAVNDLLRELSPKELLSHENLTAHTVGFGKLQIGIRGRDSCEEDFFIFDLSKMLLREAMTTQFNRSEMKKDDVHPWAHELRNLADKIDNNHYPVMEDSE
jgi:hypothetical protein